MVEDGEAAVAEVARGHGGSARRVCAALVCEQGGQKHVWKRQGCSRVQHGVHASRELVLELEDVTDLHFLA